MNKPFVRPDVRAFLLALEEKPRPVINAEIIPLMREALAEMTPEMFEQVSQDLPAGTLGEIRQVTMPGPGGDIELRLFDVRESRPAGPVVVFYHGGGFVTGSVDTHAGLAAEISRQLDLPVISVEYRLAPESPWPAAPDDSEAAARWIAENAAAFGREFTGLVLCGDSAGGTLTIVTSVALRDRPSALPVVAQLALYPKADSSRPYPSEEQFAEGYSMHREEMAYFHQAYNANPMDWRGSPQLADQSRMPPTLVVTASLDPLRDSGRAYAAATIAAGVDTTYIEIQGTIHGFCTYRKALPSACEDLTRIMRAARNMIA